MRLLAISDLHVNHAANRDALERIEEHPDDWLIVAGDVSERPDMLAFTLDILARRFARVIFVPGNHDLWALGPGAEERGEARYDLLVEIARACGVLTPEDPFPVWPGPGGPLTICPLFLLYDYSFRPAGMPIEDVVAWARDGRAVCADEMHLDFRPHASRAEWCRSRVLRSQERLDALPADVRTVLVNHWPLRLDLVRIPRIPRFSPWCGTVLTADWHRRYRAEVAISGHLHVRRTDMIDGTRFEEVSLGYPRQWRPERGLARYLRQILPAPG